MEPVQEEGIISIMGNRAVDNPRINLYRLLEKRNNEWYPIFEADNLQTIKLYIQTEKLKLKDIWERRCRWLLENLNNGELSNKTPDEIINLIDSKI